MKKTSLVNTTACIVFLFGAHEVACEEAPAKDRFRQAIQILDSDASSANFELVNLCSESYARACARAGYHALKGIGVEQDTTKAIEFYRHAVRGGHHASSTSLGKVHLQRGEYEMAIEALSKAADADDARARATLAWAHATNRLGALSRPESGFATLLETAQLGQRDAELLLLDAWSKARVKDSNVDGILIALHKRWVGGDAKAAEVLLRYYRLVGHKRGTPLVRSELLATQGLRDKIRVEEGLYLASVDDPNDFWERSEQLVRGAPNGVFARALAVSAKINKNAYVRIVQKELRALGYPVGRPSPYMNRPLIRSIDAFCRDHGVGEVCRNGPLKSATIKTVAALLAELRASG